MATKILLFLFVSTSLFFIALLLDHLKLGTNFSQFFLEHFICVAHNSLADKLICQCATSYFRILEFHLPVAFNHLLPVILENLEHGLAKIVVIMIRA